jgi:hypothetical protein
MRVGRPPGSGCPWLRIRAPFRGHLAGAPGAGSLPRSTGTGSARTRDAGPIFKVGGALDGGRASRIPRMLRPPLSEVDCPPPGWQTCRTMVANVVEGHQDPDRGSLLPEYARQLNRTLCQ